MHYIVAIDNLKLQINLHNPQGQATLLQKIVDALQSTYSSLYIEYGVLNKGVLIHKVYTAGKKILELKTGISPLKKDTTPYYLLIEFAGMKQYTHNDTLATNCLVRICAYLNSNSYNFIYTGIDICVDIYAPMFRTFVFCNKKASGVKYYSIDEKQPYSTTRYLEKYNRTHKQVMRRSYLYDKPILVDNKTIHITRFEIKLQSRYFNRNRYDANTLKANLDKYHILYFPTAEDRIYAYERYRMFENKIRRRDIHKLGLERYRLLPNTNELESFLLELYNIYEHDLDLPVKAVKEEVDWFFKV